MSAVPRIRVLVIDDSATSRQAIARMLSASPLVEVVGTARDGDEALRLATLLAPDLITLDLEMPRMDGFTLLRIVMSRCPTPVIVISARGAAGDVFRALELGAADFIAKPTGAAAPELASIERELLRKVHAVRELRADALRARLSRGGAPRPPPSTAGAGVEPGGAAGGGRRRVDRRARRADGDPRRLRGAPADRLPRRTAHARGLHARLRRAPRPPHRLRRARGRGRRGAGAGRGARRRGGLAPRGRGCGGARADAGRAGPAGRSLRPLGRPALRVRRQGLRRGPARRRAHRHGRRRGARRPRREGRRRLGRRRVGAHGRDPRHARPGDPHRRRRPRAPAARDRGGDPRRRAGRDRFDLALIDPDMPAMDGLEPIGLTKAEESLRRVPSS